MFETLMIKNLNRIETIVRERRDDFIKEWNRHFTI